MDSRQFCSEHSLVHVHEPLLFGYGKWDVMGTDRAQVEHILGGLKFTIKVVL